MDEEVRKKFLSLLMAAAALPKEKKLIELLPYFHQGDGLFGPKWVWMANRTLNLVTAVQAKYIEFCNSRFTAPEIKFFSMGEGKPVLVRMFSGHYFRNTGAIIAPFLPGCDYPIPERKEGWGNDWEKTVRRGEMPVVEDGEGGPLFGEEDPDPGVDRRGIAG